MLFRAFHQHADAVYDDVRLDLCHRFRHGIRIPHVQHYAVCCQRSTVYDIDYLISSGVMQVMVHDMAGHSGSTEQQYFSHTYKLDN